MDVDSEVEPTLQDMAKRMAVMRADLLPALRQLDEDTIVSYYSVDEQARLYLSAAFTLALSLYSLDKITHRQVAAASVTAPRLTGAGTRNNNNNSEAPASTDTQLVLKIERITEYIKKLQEIAALERSRKLSTTAAEKTLEEPTATAVAGKKRGRETSPSSAASASSEAAAKKLKPDVVAETDSTVAKVEGSNGEVAEDEYGDAQMFSVVSRVAGETGTLVSRLLKQVMTSKSE